MASALARYQATCSTWVANLRHTGVEVSPLQRIILQYLDGKHSRDAIVDKVLQLATSGSIDIELKGGSSTTPLDVAPGVDLAVGSALKDLALKAVLST